MSAIMWSLIHATSNRFYFGWVIYCGVFGLGSGLVNVEMGNPKEVEQLLCDGNFLELSLADLQKEHAELIAFNTVIDRKLKTEKTTARKYQGKVAMIADLLRDPSDQALTLKAIKTVVEVCGE